MNELMQQYGWILHIFVIVLVTLVLHTISNKLIRILYSKAIRSNTYWDDSFLHAFRKPLGVFIWVMGLSIALVIGVNHTPNEKLLAFVTMARKILTLGLIVWFLMRFIKNIEKNILLKSKSKKNRLDETAVHAISQLLMISILITSLIVGMQMIGLPVSGLVAFGGIGGAGIAFAAKDVLANFFGGLMVYLDRPFKVGDWIYSPDRDIEGTVELIGWRLTRIRTFDKRPQYVPNSLFSTITVQNASRMSNRRIRTLVGVRYDDATKIRSITDAIEKMIREHQDIDSRQTIIVNLQEFAASSLNILIYCFTKTTNWIPFQNIQQDVFLKIIDIITEHGAECAFPTQTLHIQKSEEFKS